VETTYAFGDQPLKEGDTLADIDLALCDPLTGPPYVEGAEPGDSIALHIDDVQTVGAGAQGVISNFGVLEWDRLPLYFFTPEEGRVKWLRGIEYDVQPNVGAIGVAFTKRFNAIECPEGVEPWPCAEEFSAAGDGDRREVTRLGRNSVVSTDA